jgi:hypothetical protein
MKLLKNYGINDLIAVGVETESKILVLMWDVTPGIKNDKTERIQMFIKPEDVKDILKFLNKSVKDFKKENPKSNVYA